MKFKELEVGMVFYWFESHFHITHIGNDYIIRLWGDNSGGQMSRDDWDDRSAVYRFSKQKTIEKKIELQIMEFIKEQS